MPSEDYPEPNPTDAYLRVPRYKELRSIKALGLGSQGFTMH